MRMWDAEIRQDPNINKIWLEAFKNARIGWGHYNWGIEALERNPEFAYNLSLKAEEYLVRALQILAHNKLQNTKLYAEVYKTLEDLCGRCAV